MRINSRLVVAGALSVAAIVVLAGCSSSPTPASTSAGAKVEPLVLNAAEGYDAVMAKAFTKKTGIPVKLDDDATRPLMTKITAKKNTPQWSLLWVDGHTASASLDQQGL